jgi:hypothetical protein
LISVTGGRKGSAQAVVGTRLLVLVADLARQVKRRRVAVTSVTRLAAGQ